MCNNHSHEHNHDGHTYSHEHDHNHEEDFINVPRLGEKAPFFSARTTMGQRSLDDYNGRWLVLFSYGNNFTPVSATELLDFTRHFENFRALDAEILAVSGDSINSHIAWALSLGEKHGTKIPFPLVADVAGALSFDYGLICPNENNEQNARCLFIIDDTQKVRFASYYPTEVGRNASEVLRVLSALKTFTGTNMAAPASWQTGEEGVKNAPLTIDEV